LFLGIRSMRSRRCENVGAESDMSMDLHIQYLIA